MKTSIKLTIISLSAAIATVSILTMMNGFNKFTLVEPAQA